MDIIPSKSSKSLTKETTFANYVLIVDAYYKIKKSLWNEKYHY